jgi:hypothetical protein
MGEIAMNCGNCIYARINNETSVSCHRYPPTVTEADGTKVTCYFPLLGVLQWCGEHKRRPKSWKE